MKIFFAFVVTTSFLLGIIGGMLIGGMLLGATRAAAPASMPADPHAASTAVRESIPDEPGEIATGMPQATARMQLPPARKEALPISVIVDAGDVARAPLPADLGPEDETLASRLAIEGDQPALQAWLPFRQFVKQHQIDTRSLADETVKALFARFADRYAQRTAELIRIARPRTPDELLGEHPVAQEEPAAVEAVEAVEARLVADEEVLALEFRGR